MSKGVSNVFGGNEYEVGMAALNDLHMNGTLGDFQKLQAQFQEVEAIGGAPQFEYEGLGLIAPTTIRYASAALDIATYTGDIKTVVEVGGGYGGMCKALSVVKKWDSYTIVDVPEPFALAKAYTKHFGLEITDQIPEEIDLFIADSSMAECTLEAQEMYALLAAKAKYVYITYNTIHKAIGRAGFLLTISILHKHNRRIRGMGAPKMGETMESILKLIAWK